MGVGGFLGGGFVTFEDADGGSKVVDPPGSLEGSGDDGRRGDEIVGEGVVEVALAESTTISP